MYCGSRRIAASTSAQVSSAARHWRALALGHGDAQARAGVDIDVRADAAGLRDQLSLGSFSSSCRGNCVRSRIVTRMSASRRRTESWPMPLTVLVNTLAL